VIEDNTAVGNVIGIILVAGVQGETVRRNFVLGNPPLQVAVDHPSVGPAADIVNLATAGANTFHANVCLTSVNAPCPAPTPPSLTASPNPIPVSGSAIMGVTTLSWNAPNVQVVEIHLDSPDGKLFTRTGNRGSAQTGPWVADGMTFYLQDVTAGKPLTADYTLATVVVHLQTSRSGLLRFRGGPRIWWGGAGALLLALLVRFRRPRNTWVGACLLAAVFSGTLSAQSSAQDTSATLDRMAATHKGQREMAKYVFDTQGCKSCHTAGENGKLGFTPRGKDTAKGFEGCIAMLTAVSHIAQVPTDQRSPQQQRKLGRFNEFGCTFCHRVGANNMAMTQVGARLANLHLGCVEIEKTLASKL